MCLRSEEEEKELKHRVREPRKAAEEMPLTKVTVEVVA
jgi:hypothetical protein